MKMKRERLISLCLSLSLYPLLSYRILTISLVLVNDYNNTFCNYVFFWRCHFLLCPDIKTSIEKHSCVQIFMLNTAAESPQVYLCLDI